MRPARLIGRSQAIALVAGKTGKPGGVDPAGWFKGDPDDALYAFGAFPLAAFAPNEAGERYDGTVEMARALAYAGMPGHPPPVLCGFGRGDWVLRIHDGGHRITAARLAGAGSIPAIVRFKPGQLLALAAPGGPLNLRGWSIDLASMPGVADHGAPRCRDHSKIVQRACGLDAGKPAKMRAKGLSM